MGGMASTPKAPKVPARESVAELKTFTSWMRDQKVKRFKYGRLEVEFADQALAAPAPARPQKTEEEMRDEIRKEVEATLFMSAGGSQ